MKKAIALIFLFLNVTPLFSQQKSFEIIGVIVDQSSQAPIPFATVVVLDNTSLDPITGVTTAEDGSFSVRSPYEDIYVEISFIGYETLKRQDFQVNGALLDLGTIALSEQSEMLNEVEVRGEK